MTKIFALLAVLLIASGAIVLVVPKSTPTAVTERSIGPQGAPIQSIADQAREIAEKVNAPLSIIFGLVSLYYSRRNYIQNRDALARRQID